MRCCTLKKEFWEGVRKRIESNRGYSLENLQPSSGREPILSNSIEDHETARINLKNILKNKKIQLFMIN